MLTLRLIIASFIVFLGKSCSNNSSLPVEEFNNDIHINIKANEVNEYHTSIDNHMGVVQIIDSTKHHEISELYTKSGDFDIYHRYKPLKNYLGNDTLKLRRKRINDTSGEIISIKNVTIILTQDEN